MVDATDFFSESTGESRGEVFTREEVVNFILDLVGWREEADIDLNDCRLLEPSCGNGEFLIPAIRRFLKSRGAGTETVSAKEIEHRFVAIEVNKLALKECRKRVRDLLIEFTFSKKDAPFLRKVLTYSLKKDAMGLFVLTDG